MFVLEHFVVNMGIRSIQKSLLIATSIFLCALIIITCSFYKSRYYNHRTRKGLLNRSTHIKRIEDLPDLSLDNLNPQRTLQITEKIHVDDVDDVNLEFIVQNDTDETLNTTAMESTSNPFNSDQQLQLFLEELTPLVLQMPKFYTVTNISQRLGADTETGGLAENALRALHNSPAFSRIATDLQCKAMLDNRVWQWSTREQDTNAFKATLDVMSNHALKQSCDVYKKTMGYMLGKFQLYANF